MSAVQQSCCSAKRSCSVFHASGACLTAAALRDWMRSSGHFLGASLVLLKPSQDAWGQGRFCGRATHGRGKWEGQQAHLAIGSQKIASNTGACLPQVYHKWDLVLPRKLSAGPAVSTSTNSPASNQRWCQILLASCKNANWRLKLTEPVASRRLLQHAISVAVIDLEELRHSIVWLWLGVC